MYFYCSLFCVYVRMVRRFTRKYWQEVESISHWRPGSGVFHGIKPHIRLFTPGHGLFIIYQNTNYDWSAGRSLQSYLMITRYKCSANWSLLTYFSKNLKLFTLPPLSTCLHLRMWLFPPANVKINLLKNTNDN